MSAESSNGGVRLPPLDDDGGGEGPGSATMDLDRPAPPAGKPRRATEYPYPSHFSIAAPRRSGWRRMLPTSCGSLAAVRDGLIAFRESLQHFWTVKLAQALCVGYIVVLTFAPAPVGLLDPASGRIIDPDDPAATAAGLLGGRPVVASTSLQMACLAISRMSAFSLYPVMVLVFIAFDVWLHTLFHLIRWGTAGNISLLWTHSTGLTGLVVVLATPFITLPMLYMKKTLPYEVRKALHYLFYVFALGMCFHVPASGVPNGGFLPYLLGFCITVYALDALYIELFMTERVETTTFHVLPSGVQMTMAVSTRFQQRFAKGGYAYVCLPWVSRNQWHAFSLFEDPLDSTRRQVFMQKTGDWTNAVHAALQRSTVRPVFVQGPFTSPYHAAIQFDNQVLVASGIGITPALSVIKAHRDSRRVNLIWAVRDPAMLEFFLERFELDSYAWNLIFYTGKEPINPTLEELQTNVRIIKQRPNLFSVIPNIIYGIESKKGLPEMYMDRQPDISAIRAELAEMADKDPSRSAHQQLRDLHRVAQRYGYNFSELCREMAIDLPAGTAAQDPNTNTVGSRSGVLYHTAESLADGGTAALPAGAAADAEGETEPLIPGAVPPTLSAVDEDRQTLEGLPHNAGQTLSPETLLQQIRTSSFSRPSTRPAVLERSDSVYSRIFGSASIQSDREVQRYIRSMDRNALNSWGILYCGGSKPVEEALISISSKYDIHLSTESFAW